MLTIAKKVETLEDRIATTKSFHKKDMAIRYKKYSLVLCLELSVIGTVIKLN